MTFSRRSSLDVEVIVLVAATYVVTGLAFAALAGSASSTQGRALWRFLAWAVSAGAFTWHVRHEIRAMFRRPATVAFRVCVSVALAAFVLAVAADLHARSLQTQSIARNDAALIIWPVLIALPAFVVALGIAIVLRRIRR